MEITSLPKSTSTTNRLCYQYNPSEIPPKFHFHQLPSIELVNEAKLAPRQFPIEPLGPGRHWEPGWDQGMRCNIRFFVDKPIVRSVPPHLTRTSLQQPSADSEDLKDCSAPSQTSPAEEENSGGGSDSKASIGDKEGEGRGKESKKVEEEEEKGSEREDDNEEEKEFDPDDPLKGLSQEEIRRLAIRRFYTSSTLRMTEESCLSVPKVRVPNTTMERNADMVKYRPRRYDLARARWQEIAPPVWDRIQERARIKPRLSYPRPTPVINTTAFCPIPPIRKTKPGSLKGNDGVNTSVDAGITDLIKRDKLLTSTYVRQCPGYAGYRPRSPLRIPMENRKEPNLTMMSTMKASYRPTMFPMIGMDDFPHPGPMSRTVTLTYPYNPFNKVEKIRGSGNWLP